MLSRTKHLFQLRRNFNLNLKVIGSVRLFYEETKNEHFNEKNKVPGNIKEKFTVYKEENAIEILDIEEQKLNDFIINLNETHVIKERNEEGLNLNRGLTGVYDIEDLVDVLERENAENIFVCPVAPELKYVDHMCIVTGKSYRHMVAIAQYVRKIYKKKRASNDILPKIEGIDCQNWIAMDLGNIALHIFSAEARERYDLETLWSLGPEFDNESNKLSVDLNLYEEYTKNMNGGNDVQNLKT